MSLARTFEIELMAKHHRGCYCRNLPYGLDTAYVIRGIHVGRWHVAFSVPSCRYNTVTGPVRNTLDAMAADFGWRCGDLFHADAPHKKRIEPSCVHDNRPLFDEWCKAVLDCPEMARGGPGRSVSYYRYRDALSAFARRVPRIMCSCGRRLPRHERSAARVHTYLVSDPPYLKIGKTVDIKRRFPNGLSTDNPRPLRVLAQLCGNHEGTLHSRFYRYRVRGEWFKDVPSIRQAFGIGVPVDANQAQLALPDLSWQEVYA